MTAKETDTLIWTTGFLAALATEHFLGALVIIGVQMLVRSASNEKGSKPSTSPTD